MLRVLHGLEAGHITLGLIFLAFLVFVVTPFLKHRLFNRGRGGSVYLPHARNLTPDQVGQARKFLRDKAREKTETKTATDE